MDRAKPPQLLHEPDNSLPLHKIMLFELGMDYGLRINHFFFFRRCDRYLLTCRVSAEVQLLLVALRGEVDQISRLGPGESLESLFRSDLVCYIDDRECFSQYSTTSTVVGISRLATTAAAAASTGASVVAPALDGIQLDRFIDRRRSSWGILNLTEVDVSLDPCQRHNQLPS